MHHVRLLLVVMVLLQFNAAGARTYRRWVEAETLCDTIRTWAVPTGYETLVVEFCVAMDGPSDGNGTDPCSWQFAVTLIDGTQHVMTVGWGNTCIGDFTDTRYLQVDGVTSSPVRFSSNVNLYDGDNTVIIEVENGDVAKIYVGSELMNYVGEIALVKPVRAISVIAAGREVRLPFMCIECELPVNLDSGLDETAIDAACSSNLPAPLGLWHYFDRDNDASYARPGGTYSLVVVDDSQNPGQFLIIYLDGARVNAGKWKPGMIKGRLIPTRFAGRYTLVWWDASMKLVGGEATAIVEPELMTLVFPLLHTQMRYSR